MEKPQEFSENQQAIIDELSHVETATIVRDQRVTKLGEVVVDFTLFSLAINAFGAMVHSHDAGAAEATLFAFLLYRARHEGRIVNDLRKYELDWRTKHPNRHPLPMPTPPEEPPKQGRFKAATNRMRRSSKQPQTEQ